ncbi:unnamed protein product, partial [Rotaria sp. Silwood2]
MASGSGADPIHSTFTNSNVNITSGHAGMYPVHRIGT